MKSDKLDLMSVQDYASVLKKELPSYVFQPVPSRLLILFLHSLIVFISIYFSVTGDILIIQILLSVLAGHSLGIMGLIGHEVLHGSVIRNRKWQLIIGGYCTIQFGLHPKVWKAWHNSEHHKHTQDPIYDPDCFGHIMIYRNSKVLRFIENYLPGSGYIRSVFFLFFWYSFHSAVVIFYYSNTFLDSKMRRKGKVFLVLSMATWIFTVIYFGGLSGFIFAFLIPLSISNFLIMSYIATNHFLSPLTPSKNDPLINSLTVRSVKWIEKLHLNNCYHVEHHVLPGINPKYAPIVNKALKRLWPDRFKEMSHLKALQQLYKTPRFYSKWDTLQNPSTGERFQTVYSDINNSEIARQVKK